MPLSRASTRGRYSRIEGVTPLPGPDRRHRPPCGRGGVGALPLRPRPSAEEEGSSKGKPTDQRSAIMRPATKRKKRRKTYGRRRVGVRIRPLAISPILGELAVGDVVHHVRHLCMRHLPGAQPARVEAAAHLANHVRPALEQKYSVLHEGGHQVGSGQALRLDHHPEPRDGCVPGLGQRPGPVAP